MLHKSKIKNSLKSVFDNDSWQLPKERSLNEFLPLRSRVFLWLNVASLRHRLGISFYLLT